MYVESRLPVHSFTWTSLKHRCIFPCKKPSVIISSEISTSIDSQHWSYWSSWQQRPCVRVDIENLSVLASSTWIIQPGATYSEDPPVRKRGGRLIPSIDYHLR